MIFECIKTEDEYAFNFSVGQQYSRDMVANVMGLEDEKRVGNWLTGLSQQKDVYFVFCNVNEQGRTGHNYNNHFNDGPSTKLSWSGATNSKKRILKIIKLSDPTSEVHIFWREDNREFTYGGIGQALEVSDDVPVRIIWRLNNPCGVDILGFAEDDDENLEDGAVEGRKKKASVNVYERNPLNRKKCLASYVYDCTVCSFNFGNVFGNIGEGFIHVHHLVQVSKREENYKVNPVKD